MYVTVERQETKTILEQVIRCDGCGADYPTEKTLLAEWISFRMAYHEGHACDAMCMVEIFGGEEARTAAEAEAARTELASPSQDGAALHEADDDRGEM